MKWNRQKELHVAANKAAAMQEMKRGPVVNKKGSHLYEESFGKKQ